ncbi:WecB/TagA/CpsF family glycosyltransferase [Desulfococcaceae bacterium HSG9]|nr:WecB/TagA/CpsF family glycosyltransferase [Desulfococcaceae bacterium HSG9]
MNQETVIILGIPIDNLTLDSALETIFSMIDAYAQDSRPRLIATVNVDFVVNTLKWRLKSIRHPELLDILRRADLVTADGMPIVWTSKLLGAPLQERVTGADMVPALGREAAERGKSLFLLGGKGDVGQRAADVLTKRNPGLEIAGVYAPFVHVEGEALDFTEQEDREIVERINRSGADILLIGFGNPKQEIWFERNRNRLNVPVSIGIGGTYEFIVGTVTRAPRWMQKTGTEWIFRITQDPKRLWKRYFVGFFKFGLMIFPAVLYYRYKNLMYKLTHRKPVAENGADMSVTANPYITVIKLPKRLDAAYVSKAAAFIEKATRENTMPVLDFHQCAFIDSSGLGYIVKLWHKMAEKNAKLFFTGVMHASVVRCFKLSRVYDIFKDLIFENTADVLNHIKLKRPLPSFYYTMTSEDKFVIMTLFGRLDAAQMLKLDVATIIRQIGRNPLLMHLKHLNFTDSTGLRLFLKLFKHCSGHNKTFMLCEPSDNFAQMLRITKLNTLFEIEPNLADARKMLEK